MSNAEKRLRDMFTGTSGKSSSDNSTYVGDRIPDRFLPDVRKAYGLDPDAGGTEIFRTIFYEHTEVGKKIKADILRTK